MNAADLQDALATLTAAIQAMLRTELSSIWLPVQLGSIVVAAIVAAAVATIVRRRFDLAAVTSGWPAYFRLAVRALAKNLGMLTFIVTLRIIERAFLRGQRIPHLSAHCRGQSRHRLGRDRHCHRRHP
jgi:hypothetical protein